MLRIAHALFFRTLDLLHDLLDALIDLAVDLGGRALVAFKVMLPVLVTGAALFLLVPELDAVGLPVSPVEIKRLGMSALQIVVGFWLIIALSTWLRARLDFDVRAWLKATAKTDPIAASIYLTGTFFGICWYVGKVLGL